MRALVPTLPRRAWHVLAAGGLSALANGLILPFLVVYLARVRDLPLVSAGVALSLLAVAALVLNLAMGPLVDRLGPRLPLVALLLVGGSGAVLLAYADSRPEAFAAALLLGAGMPTGWVALQPMLAAIVPSAQRGDAFAVQFALLNAGIGAGGLLAGFVVSFDRPRTFQLVFFGAAACYWAFALVMLLLRDVGRPPERTPGEGRGGYREVARDRVFARVLGLNLFLVTVGTSQLENAFAAFATGPGGASPRVLGIAFAANTLTIVLGQFPVLRLVRGRRRTRGIVVLGAFWSAAWGVVILSGLAAPGLLSSFGFVAAMVLFACGEMLHSPSIPAIVNDLAPERLRGRYNAANAVSWQLGRICGGPLAGGLLGAGLAYPLLAGLAGGAGLAAAGALRLERHLPAEANGVREPCAPDIDHASDLQLAHARPAADGDPA